MESRERALVTFCWICEDEIMDMVVMAWDFWREGGMVIVVGRD